MLLTLLGFVSAVVALALWVEQAERNRQDLDLLNRIQRRDEQALAKLYDRYSSLLYTLALRIVSTTEEAEDILQEVFLQVWNKSNSYVKERGTVYSWVIALCRNKAIDRVRSKRYKQQSREVQLNEAERMTDAHATMNPHHTVVLKEYQEIVSAAKSALSAIEAKILDLSYYGGYSQTEISQMLKMPLGTVKTKMRQGMIKLRQVLRNESSEIRDTAETLSGNEERPHQRQQHRRGRAPRHQRQHRHRPGEGGSSSSQQPPKGQAPNNSEQGGTPE